MILLPRHFFRYILREVRAVVGEESYHSIFATAGREGAIEFCRSFRQHHDSTPQEAVEGYLAQASLRGWGNLSLLSLKRDRVEIRVSTIGEELACNIFLRAKNLEDFSKLRDLKDNF